MVWLPKCRMGDWLRDRAYNRRGFRKQRIVDLDILDQSPYLWSRVDRCCRVSQPE